jgi:hypothetical protein
LVPDGNDSAMDSVPLANVQVQARAALSGFDQFISTGENYQGINNYFTLAQEDYITYRKPCNPNANGNNFLVNSTYSSDIAALVLMPCNRATVQSDGNLSGGPRPPWVVRFGQWLIAGIPRPVPACSPCLPAAAWRLTGAAATNTAWDQHCPWRRTSGGH